MKKAMVVLVMCLAVIFIAENASAISFVGAASPNLSPVFGTLVDFDDKPTGTLVGQFDYLALGVASITETSGIGSIWRYASTQSNPNYIGTGSSNGWDGTFLFEFINPVNMVGIGVANHHCGPEILTAYDGSMNILETFTPPNGYNVYAGFTRSSYDIKYFEIAGDFFAVDDLQFQPIPEPGTFLLLGTALLGLGVVGRIRRKKK